MLAYSSYFYHLMFKQKYFKYFFIFGLFIYFMGSPAYVYAQQEQVFPTKEERKKEKQERKEKRKEKLKRYREQGHSPHRATIYAMVCPGLGQIYNKKYWKLPLVYGGFGTMAYFISKNNNDYKDFKAAYDWAKAGDETIPVPNEYAEKYSEAQLKRARDVTRRNLDYSYIITGLWWALTVIDATVDAHLFEFEVSDDLALRIEPDIKIMPNEFKPYTGVKLTLKLPFSKH